MIEAEYHIVKAKETKDTELQRAFHELAETMELYEKFLGENKSEFLNSLKVDIVGYLKKATREVKNVAKEDLLKSNSN